MKANLKTMVRLVSVLLAGATMSMIATLGMVQATATGETQTYPLRPIRLIVAYPPGGGADFLARALAQKLGEFVGQPVVVENRAGATGIVGTDIVAKAAPDGYTLLFITSDQPIVSSFPTKLPYDLVSDFEAVTQLSAQPYILGEHPAVPAKTVQEFIALAKSKPGQLNYASGGNGGTPHLAAEQLKTLAGIDVVHVPYKGGGPALLAIVAGEVAIGFSSLPSTLPQVKAGKVRALAVSGAKRSPAIPDLPTIAESGVPGFDVTAWYGVMAPAKTPKPIVARLQREMVKVLNTPEFKARLEKDGTDVVGSTPEEFAEFIKSDIAKWTKVIKASGVRLE